MLSSFDGPSSLATVWWKPPRLWRRFRIYCWTNTSGWPHSGTHDWMHAVWWFYLSLYAVPGSHFNVLDVLLLYGGYCDVTDSVYLLHHKSIGCHGGNMTEPIRHQPLQSLPCTFAPFQQRECHSIDALVRRARLVPSTGAHFLDGIDILSPDNLAPVPPCWWIFQMIQSTIPALRNIEWEYLDRITLGQVRRALFDCVYLRNYPDVYEQHKQQSAKACAYPDLIRFCLFVAFRFNLGYRVFFPAMLVHQLHPLDPAIHAFQHAFQSPPDPYPAQFEVWLNNH